MEVITKSGYRIKSSGCSRVVLMVNVRMCAVRPNSMFGPKSPAERAAPRDSVISWANCETTGGYCQPVHFGQNAQQMERLGWVPGWWSSPRRCALARQEVAGQTPPLKVCTIRPQVVRLKSCQPRFPHPVCPKGVPVNEIVVFSPCPLLRLALRNGKCGFWRASRLYNLINLSFHQPHSYPVRDPM
jgi:hypothetical protein